jgi:phosphate ABC transporter permease protein PstC
MPEDATTSVSPLPAGRAAASAIHHMRTVSWLGRRSDAIIQGILLLLALTAILGLALITVFIFAQGLPFIWQTGFKDFFLSTRWSPKEHQLYGIGAMIVGSLAVTLGAMVIAAVFGLGCAIVLTQFCPKKLVSVIKPAVELLAGIPSVVYGFIGIQTLAQLVRVNLGGPGECVLVAAIVLGVMVLPTVTSISIDALQAVPRAYLDGSIALGATRWQTTRMVTLKAARSGIVAAFILGMGRAIGETMAVIMIAGNTPLVPHSILDPVRTLTATIALEMNYATGDHRRALFAVGVTLFVIIMVLNTIAMTVSRGRARRAA